MANGAMRCTVSWCIVLSPARSTITFFLSSIPSILSTRLLSPPLSGASIFPLPRCSRFPPFSPSRTCVCARAFRLFSCFYAPLVFSLPKYNWRCDAPVSLSLSTLWPPLARPLLLAFGPALSPRESDFGESWTRAGNSLTRGCRRQEALIARYLRDLLLNPYCRSESNCNIVVRKSIIIKPLHCIFSERE